MSDDLAAIPADQLLRRAAGLVERGDAEALLLHALGRDRAWLFMHGRDAVRAAVLVGVLPLRASSSLTLLSNAVSAAPTLL